MSRQLHHLAALLLCVPVLAFAGCGGGGGAGGGDFQVVATNPTPDALNVDPDTVVSATFSDPVDVATVDQTSVDLSSALGIVPGDVAYDAGTQTARFVPDEALPLATPHQMTVMPDVASLEGESLGQTFQARFSTRDGILEPSALLETETVDSDQNPVFLANAEGRGGVLWRRELPSGFTALYARSFDSAVGFGLLRLVASASGFISANARNFCVAPDGRMVVGWAFGDAFARTYDPDSQTWSLIRRLSASGAAEEALGLRLCTDAQGNIIVMWRQREAGNIFDESDLWFARYDAATVTWSPAALVENDSGAVIAGALAMGANGHAALIWSQRAGPYRLFGRVFTPGLGWSSAEILSDPDTDGDAFASDAVIDSEGDILVAYRQRGGASSGSDQVPSVVRYVAGGGPGAGWQGAEDLAPSVHAVQDLQAHVDGEGNAWVVWTHDTPSEQVLARRHLKDGGWGETHVVSGPYDDEFRPGGVSVGSNPRGGLVVAWAQEDGSSDVLRAAMYDPDTGWSAPEALNLESSDTTTPHAALDHTGNALVTWRQKVEGADPARTEGWFNRYVRGVGWIGPALLDAGEETSTRNSLPVLDRFGRGAIVREEARPSGGSPGALDYDLWYHLFR